MSDERTVTISIPEDVTIASLKLTRDPETGAVGFDWTPIERICEASGIDVALFRDTSEGNVAGLLFDWYAQERKRGGPPDQVLEELAAEALVEEALDKSRAQGGWMK